MKRPQRHTAALASAIAGVVVAVPGLAQQAAGTQATRFEFRAPAGCSSAEDFAARVSKRSWRIKLSNAGGAGRSLLVEIRPGATLRGTVTVVEADGATRTRQLKAKSCEEAVDALSLIAAVTLDPDATLGEPAPEAPPEPASAAPPSSPPPPPAPSSPPPAPPRVQPAPRYRVSLGLGGALLLHMAPGAAFGATASAALELDPGDLLAPFLRLSLLHAQRRGVAERGGQASFAFTLPTLDACPVRFGPRVLGLRPCAYGSLGLLEVWGEGSLQNETHARLYGSAGVAAWLGWRVSETFEIIADGRAGLPFRRDEFAFDGQGFFESPRAAFSFGLGAAGGFP